MTFRLAIPWLVLCCQVLTCAVASENDGLNRLSAERIRSATGASWSGWAPAAVPQSPASGDILYDDGAWSATRRLGYTGKRRKLDEVINGASRNYEYDYDSLGRLKKETVLSGASSGVVSYDGAAGYGDVGYDKVGNRGKRDSTIPGVAQRTYAPYDANDRLGNYTLPVNGQISARFDSNGNTLQFDLDGSGPPNWDQASSDTYDLENRLTGAVRNSGVLAFVYDADGNRVKKTVGATAIYFLVEDRNATGYAQVLEESATAGGTPTVTYSIGLGLISQTRNGTTTYYGTDGLGSIRYLTSSAGAVTDTYFYDAFGVQVSSTGSTINAFRYAGEQLDADLGMYYLRARYYSPEIGRFWTMDTFEGHQSDPLSLHKYLYCAADPVNNTDPSGMFTQAFGYLAEDAIQDVYAMDHPGDTVLNGKWTRLGSGPGPLNPAYRLKPDIFNTTTKRWAEIKPFSPSGVAKAGVQYGVYLAAFAPFKYLPDASWTPSTHEALAGSVPIIFWNAGGIIFYTDALDLAEDVLVLGSLELAKNYMAKYGTRLATRTLMPALVRVSSLAASARMADGARFQQHLGIAGVLAIGGAF